MKHLPEKSTPLTLLYVKQFPIAKSTSWKPCTSITNDDCELRLTTSNLTSSAKFEITSPRTNGLLSATFLIPFLKKRQNQPSKLPGIPTVSKASQMLSMTLMQMTADALEETMKEIDD